MLGMQLPMGLKLVVDNGSTGLPWDAMASQPQHYAPLIRRQVEYYLMTGVTEDDRDFPEMGTMIAIPPPSFSDQTEDGAYFVRIGALNVFCQFNPETPLDRMDKRLSARLNRFDPSLNVDNAAKRRDNLTGKTAKPSETAGFVRNNAGGPRWLATSKFTADANTVVQLRKRYGLTALVAVEAARRPSQMKARAN